MGQDQEQDQGDQDQGDQEDKEQDQGDRTRNRGTRRTSLGLVCLVSLWDGSLVTV